MARPVKKSQEVPAAPATANSAANTNPSPNPYYNKAAAAATAPAVIKHYHQENCNRTMRSGGKVIEFRPYQLLCGTWSGTYRTSDPEEHSVLCDLMKDASSGITEIHSADYAVYDRIRASEGRRRTELIVPPPPDPTAGIMEDLVQQHRRPVTGEMDPPEPVVTVAPLSSVDAALMTGSVEQATIEPR